MTANPGRLDHDEYLKWAQDRALKVLAEGEDPTHVLSLFLADLSKRADWRRVNLAGYADTVKSGTRGAVMRWVLNPQRSE